MTDRLEALIFDVDGTLADTERDGHRVAFNQAFAEAGLDWHWDVELYGQLLVVTGGKERIRHYMEHHHPALPQASDLDDLVLRLHRRKTLHYAALIDGGSIPLRPGVLRLLEQARAEGVRLAVATTTTPDNVFALLEHALPGLPGWFDEIAAGDVVPHKKPAPDIYRYVLARLGLPPGACIAFEDSDNGLHAARAAGLLTVVAPSGYTQSQDFTGAALMLDHFGEPDRPMRILHGPPGIDGSMLDLALLRRLHSIRAADRISNSI